MKLKIIHIYENDYGCEETADDEELKYIVIVKNTGGEESELLISDSFLTEHNLDEGSDFDSSLLDSL